MMQMKIINILIFVNSLLMAFSVSAETVLACQYTKSAGFIYKNRGWMYTEFNLDKPFFLKLIDNGFVDAVSLQNINMRGGICKKTWSSINPEEISCTSSLKFMQFNTKSLEGSTTQLNGSVQTGNERDTVDISIFNCQKM